MYPASYCLDNKNGSGEKKTTFDCSQLKFTIHRYFFLVCCLIQRKEELIQNEGKWQESKKMLRILSLILGQMKKEGGGS